MNGSGDTRGGQLCGGLGGGIDFKTATSAWPSSGPGGDAPPLTCDCQKSRAHAHLPPACAATIYTTCIIILLLFIVYYVYIYTYEVHSEIT